jgi:hypothetical protein
MFKKWKKKKEEAKRLEAEKLRQREEEREKEEKLEEEKRIFFDTHNISDLFDEIVEKMTIIETAMRENDRTLINDYTGKAANIQLKFEGIGPLKLRNISTFYKFEEKFNYYNSLSVKEDSVSEVCYKMLIGDYAKGEKLFSNNFKTAYWNFKTYEKKFPESLLLLFNLRIS